MLCTVCGKVLKGHIIHVWRTISPIDISPKKWAKLPAHPECRELIEQKVMSSKIAISAGLNPYQYALEKPEEEIILLKKEELKRMGVCK